jgi:hypothetical protein
MTTLGPRAQPGPGGHEVANPAPANSLPRWPAAFRRHSSPIDGSRTSRSRSASLRT